VKDEKNAASPLIHPLNNHYPRMGFHKGRFGDFFGHHATAAERLCGKWGQHGKLGTAPYFSWKIGSCPHFPGICPKFSVERSEDVHG
jgi:hypothetical protein